jgi:flagellar hook-length control protein FliK
MQISDLVGQYHQTTTSGTDKLTGTKGVENLVASLRSLTKGNIFEGTVSSMKNGRVTLALSNGQQLSARMEGKVPLSVGQSMFFQVKSNDGTQIAIRPFVVDGNGVNYTLMTALNVAGLAVDADHLSMVNRMMQEQMPIDRNSLQQMARLVSANPDIDVQTMVQLKKLGIPITPENAAQFENYLDDKQAITDQMENFIDELPQALQGEALPVDQMRSMGEKILSVISENLPDVPEQAASSVVTADAAGEILSGDQLMQQETMEDTAVSNTAGTEAGQTEGTTQMVLDENGQPVETGGVPVKELPVANQTPHTLGAVLSEEQQNNLNALLGKVLGTDSTSYTKDSGVVEVLKDLQQILKDPLPVEREALGRLFASNEFKSLVKDTMEQQWMLTPEDLKEPDKIGKLYEKMEGQLTRLTEAMKASGQENANVTQLAADVRSNIEFMNQVNQAYTYVQIPLKMSGQNASGQLYVYTNKKALAEGDKELTAFLHLDMDHLGSTDVSVKMLNHKVNTKFYLENDGAYELLMANIPILEEKLAKKGYQCSVTVENEAKHVNFVEDFLKKDQPSAGQLHRYSFDMRA